ncbi:phosphatidate cytidylyltransferase [Flavobacteriaceae bacterium]|nr:phosphatidate cytidylyltransferase [Flavobacteriaceae bacterium]MDB9828003.1 phosphatidate cytidylyltransferase [Flavobacteriaceae bacterium]
MREIVVRSISGILYVLIVVFSMYTSRELFMILFLILGLQTLKEFKKLIGLKHFTPYLLLPISLLLISYYYPGDIILYTYLGISLLVSILLAKDVQSTTNSLLLKKQKYIPTMLYIISGFVFLTLIPFSKEVFKPEIIVGVFVLIWCNDTFAYIIGKSLGKNKLLERVSPKKTIEGFFGGLLGAVIASFIIFNLLNIYTLPVWISLAVIISVCGSIGDLVQSNYKRQAGVKDSGNLMPGHGGLYDRLDSAIYASPFIYAFLQLITYVS